MVDINLLPDELRGRESAERKRLHKVPKVEEIRLTNPPPPQEPKLGPGGTGFGRPAPPPRPPASLQPPPAAPPPPLPLLPPQPERRHFTFAAAARLKPPLPPAASSAGSPAVQPPAQRLDAAESARLAAIVKREVKITQERAVAASKPAAKRRGGFLAWLRGLLARRPKPRTMAPPPAPKATPLPPPPKPQPAPPAVKVVLSKAPPPKAPARPRRSFWKWLRTLWHRQPKVKVSAAPPVAPKVVPPPPTKPPPPPAVPPPLPKPAPAAVAAKPPPPSRPATAKAPPKAVGEPTVGRPFKTLTVNLLPEEFAHHPELNLSRKFLVYLASLGVCAFAILTVSQIISLYYNSIGNEIRRSQRQIDEYLRQIDQFQSYVSLSQQKLQELDRMEQLLSGHRYLTQAFVHLQQLTVDDVSYSSLALAGEGTVSLQATGRDYRTVARQLVAFQEATDVVKAVTITGASGMAAPGSRELNKVTFSIVLELQPAAFLNPITSPTP